MIIEITIQRFESLMLRNEVESIWYIDVMFYLDNSKNKFNFFSKNILLFEIVVVYYLLSVVCYLCKLINIIRY